MDVSANGHLHGCCRVVFLHSGALGVVFALFEFLCEFYPLMLVLTSTFVEHKRGNKLQNLT